MQNLQRAPGMEPLWSSQIWGCVAGAQRAAEIELRESLSRRKRRYPAAVGRAVDGWAALRRSYYAFNVAPFWRQPKEALGIVRRHLAPDGAVYLFWDALHTQPGRARDLADQLSERVRLAEFSVNQVLVKDLHPVPAVCVIGRP